MELRPRRLAGLFDVVAPRLPDHRGFLHKPFESSGFAAFGQDRAWRQLIHSHTDRANTVRGLYVQSAPFSEGKLVACLRGTMFWVVVDLRRASSTFAHWDGTTLREGDAILVERGFAHGCLSLTDDTDLLLAADNAHADGIGIRWDDPDIGIAWPRLGTAPIISDVHEAYPSFARFKADVGGL